MNGEPQTQAVADALGVLLAPLRYATRDGARGLDRLRGFESLVGRVVDRARAAGGPPEILDRLRDRARGFDRLAPPVRAKRMALLLADLGKVLPLPAELLAFATHSQTEKPEKTQERGAAAPTLAAAVRPPVTPAIKGTATPHAPTVDADGVELIPHLGRANPRLSQVLERRGIKHVGELLFATPRSYEDRRRLRRIADLKVGEPGVALATVRLAGEVRGGKGRRFYRVMLADESGTLTATWFRYPSWLRGRYPVGKRYLVSGEIRAGYGNAREVAHPELEPADKSDADRVNFGRIVPIYPGIDRTEHRSYRQLTYGVIERHAAQVTDRMPASLLRRLGMPSLGDALREVHWPGSAASMEELNDRRTAGHRRLAFDELFLVQLGLALRRRQVKSFPGIAFRADGEILERALARLPFSLTHAQRRALSEIAADMASPEPMNRLLQGDVGSGKTAVALVAALIAVANRHQAAVMAPTELLAEQHFRTFEHLLKGSDVRLALMTSSASADRDKVLAALALGEVHVAVGTHALFQEGVEFQRLGLAIIDEQHRFGVLHRAALMQKGTHPDVLALTATPIPRTLAMAYCGDLDLSVIDELPAGRLPVKTRVFGESRRERAWEIVERELRAGRQAYVVYPLVEESEKVDLGDATRGAEELKKRFPEFEVGLVHGRMARDERESVMDRFRKGQMSVLVATTVVEVGVDVPNATVMVVESAERFGLSQLHQLRGRVRRSVYAAHCLLVASYARSEGARERLSIMEKSDDGFAIAAKDLEIRGPGEVLGTRQSGVPELCVADLARHQDLLTLAREEAMRIASSDPHLSSPEHAPLRTLLDGRWNGRLSLARVG